MNNNKQNPVIKSPSKIVLEKYLKKWNSLDNYVFQESSLRKLFSKTYPLNNIMDNVLIKVCSLNDFYSTNIFSPFAVAKHIITLEIDEKISIGDLSIVNRKIRTRTNSGKIKSIITIIWNYIFFACPVVS